MTINNQTIHGGNQQFSNATGIEQEVMDALREQAQDSRRECHGKIAANGHVRPEDTWRDYLTPKAAALYTKMEASQKKNQ